MRCLWIFLFAFLPAVHYSSGECERGENVGDNDSGFCPVWTTSGENNTCVCGKWLEASVVRCYDKNKTVTLPFCYCMSRNDLLNTTVFGYCVVRCYIDHNDPVRLLSDTSTLTRYKILVSNDHNETETNRLLCSDLKLNRVGQMCGKCEEGYAPPAYGYSQKCVRCSNYKLNWLKYIAIAYLPLTVFYLSVILFRISVTSAGVNGYIATCQIFTSPCFLRYFTVTVIDCTGNNFLTINSFKALLTIIGIWNLDFFRAWYTPFCIHPNMSTLSTLSLEYVIAVYPLLLVIVTYIIVTLHDRHIIVVRIFKPFYKCFRFFRNEWDPRTSLISAFATFILLSYVKILNTSLDLLTPLALYDMNGNTIKQQYLGVDGTVEYFGKEHLPYAVLAVVMCLLFNVLPLLLLCVYSSQCFLKCVDYLNLHSNVVYTFAEVFQGCFKTHPRDYRFFAVLYILLRIVNILFSFSFADGFVMYFPLAAIVLAFAVVLVAIAKPYKSCFANNADVVVFSIASIGFSGTSVRGQLLHTHEHNGSCIMNVIATVLTLIFAVYGIGVLVFMFLPKRFLSCSYLLQKCWKSVKVSNNATHSSDVPYRLQHSDDPEYAPLLP